MMTARAVVPVGLGLDLQFSDTTCNCQGRVNQALQYLQFIFFQEIPMSKCFGVFLICFALLFCCLRRAVESVVRCLGAISAETIREVKFFLIFFKPGSFPAGFKWLCCRRQRALQGRAEALGQCLLTWAVSPASLALLKPHLHWSTVSDTLE